MAVGGAGVVRSALIALLRVCEAGAAVERPGRVAWPARTVATPDAALCRGSARGPSGGRVGVVTRKGGSRPQDNGLFGDVMEDNIPRGVGGECTALLGQEGLSNGRLVGPDLGVGHVVHEVRKAQKGGEGVGPRVGLGVHLEKTGEEAEVVAWEAPSVCDRAGAQGVVASGRREARWAKIVWELPHAAGKKGVLEP